MAITAQDIITDALTDIGVVMAGESPAAEDSAYGLRVLNRMVDSWASEKLTVLGLGTTTCSLSGAASYTIGTGGAINVARPAQIASVVVRLSNGSEKRADPVSPQAWDDIIDKARTGAFADRYYYDNGYPMGIIYLNPMPATGTLEVKHYKVITGFSTLATTVDYPPGYQRALVTNLAIELVPAFQKPASQVLVALALHAKQLVMQSNAEVLGLPPSGAAQQAAQAVNQGAGR
jgi:hypothetical protein